MRILWTEQARLDLLDISPWITRDNPRVARAQVARLRAAVQHLRAHPQIGRVLPELDRPDLRERVVAPWRVIYRVEEGRVLILTVMHGRRDLEGGEVG